MKKFLSLVLALIMTMSLVTVSAGAKDFTDDDKVTYEEAVSVMSSVKVLDGYADGSFNPQGGLTRGAAAKIICNLILGPTTAAELHADTAPYKDVPVDHTFAGYIAYCAKEGIISGYADGSFRPAAPLTGYAFMKMLLGALGYDQIAEGYTGANWSINVAKQALGIGLNKGLKTEFSGIKTVTREEAALYAFNTLQSTMVEYSEKTTVNVGGAQVTLSGNAQDVEWGTATLNDGNIKKDGFVQFAEKHFPKLVKKATQDDFARPAYTWVNNKVELGTYVDWNSMVAEYTKGIKGNAVYEDIGGAAAKDFTISAYLDGFKVKTYNIEGMDKKTGRQTITKADDYSKAVAEHIYKKSDESLKDSGKGVLTQIFVNTDKEEVTITFINTWLAKAAADYNEKTEKLALTVFTNYDSNPVATVSSSYTAVLDEVANVADFEKDDMVRVNIADGIVKVVEDAEVLSDATVSSYKNEDDDADPSPTLKLVNLTTDGTKYEAAKKSYYDAEYLYNYALSQLKDNTYNIYLDAYGYILGVEPVDVDDQYIFVVGYEQKSTVLAKAIDKASIITTEGEMLTVDITDNDLSDHDAKALRLEQTNGNNGAVNKWFTYTVNKNGVYNLEELVAKQFNETEREIIAQSTKGTTGTISGLYPTLEGATIKAGVTYDGTYGGDEAVAVGNDDSTYISVKADTNYVKEGGSIEKVLSTVTGIKEVNITVTGAVTNATGAYAMYNSKGYITYAVVVGKNAGSAANLVYLTDGIGREYYDRARDEYYWEYDAIREGELTTVKTTTHKDDQKAELKEGVLYEMWFDKDDFATDVYVQEATTKLHTTEYKADGYMYKKYTNNVALSLTGMTLHLITDTDENYIVISPDCKFFVCSAATDGDYEEIPSASTALTYMGKSIGTVGEDDPMYITTKVGTTFTGVIAAVCDARGYATTLILSDTYEANDEKGVDYKPVGGSDVYSGALSFAGNQMQLKVDSTNSSDTATFEYSIIAVNTTSGYEYVAAEGDGTLAAGTATVTPEVYKASGIIKYQATITMANGDVFTTAPVMG